MQNKTKVLMVYPEFPPSFWSFSEAVKMLGLGAVMPPTGLATVAAMLPADQFDVLPIVDINLEPLLDEHLEQADLVMVSAMIVQQDSLRQIIAQAKRFNKPVVAGGPYPTSYADKVAEMGADYLVLNEAETTLAPFVDDWLTGRAERVYDELSVRSRTTVDLTREGKPKISNTPIPRWDLLKLSRYSSMAVQFSRGCPFNCEFCDITSLFGHIPRTKTADQFIAELEAIRQTGWRGSVFIVDDNFIGNRSAVRDLLPPLTEWQKHHGFPFSFFTEASVDLANETLRDVRENMVKAGFGEVFCGIESVNPEVLDEMGKKQNRGDIRQKVRILQKAGLEVTAGFIIGNDGDQITVFDELFRFIQEEGIVTAMIGLLTAPRGTALYRRLEAEGRLRADCSGNNTHQLCMNFKPKLDERFLIKGYIDLLERLFSSRNYYARCRALRRLQGPCSSSVMLNLSGITAAFKIFYRNLIRHPDWEFSKFILGTLFTAPGRLPVAIKQAIKFAHFQKITLAAVRVHRYPERVETLTELFQKRVSKLRGDVDKRLRKLARLEQKTIARATRIYRSLDPDFRTGAEKVLEQWRQYLHNCANVYRQTWRGSITAQ